MSEILSRWQAGEGLPDVLVIDGHTHFGAWPRGANFVTVEEALKKCLEAMDANGVDAACVLGGGYMASGSDYTLGNDALLELVRGAPDRLVGFAHINPNDHLESIMAELKRVESAGLRCIKLLNSYQQRYPGDGPHLSAVYRFAREHNMLILNHNWTNEEISNIARQFPSIDFILGHYGNARDPLLKEFSNVYANIWSLGNWGFVERGIANVGPEKFLFGSDAFMNPVSVGIGMVVYADIPDNHKRLILGLNQARLLDKVGALSPGIKKKYAI
jgi:predicted TIM-barrel fold metal-dependent hydrolase